MNSLLIMAGGTGGHVFPGLAVAQHMQTLGWRIDWVGTQDKMEAQLVPKFGFPIHFIDIGGLRGKGLKTKLLAPFKLFHAFLQARKILKDLQPKVVLGMGGYASGPGGLAAFSLGIPVVIHEQNAVFGMTNKYLAKIAKATLTGFDLQSSKLTNNTIAANTPSNTLYVGNPIRSNIFEIEALKNKSPNETVSILIVGGSLGALALNEQVPSILQSLASQRAIEVRHQTGKGKLQQVQQAYQASEFAQVTEFIDDMQSALAWADIVICRAGALTVAEIAGAGRVAIFVPLPIAVDDHQTANAKYLSEQGAAILLPQKDIQSTLLAHLFTLCNEPNTRINMAKRAKQCAVQTATANVADVLLSVSGSKTKQGANLNGQ